jgi:hypothetical protein
VKTRARRVRTAPTSRGSGPVSDVVKVSAAVARDVAGLGGVPAETLARHLGSSRLVYEQLLRMRDPKTGRVTVTAKLLARCLPRLGRAAHVDQDTVGYHLRKLTALALVSRAPDSERATLAAPTPAKRRAQYWRDATGALRMKFVVDRIVYGAPGAAGSTLHAVPVETQRIIAMKEAAPKKWGGPRAGAGRPKGSRRRSRRGASEESTVQTPFGRRRGAPMSTERLVSMTEQLSWGGGESNTPALATEPVPQSTRRPAGLPPMSGALLALLRPAAVQAPAAHTIQPKGALPPVEALADYVVPGLGSGIGAVNAPPARRNPVLPRHELVPPWVSVSAVARVATPPPPRLDAREPAERHAYLLAKWYEGAVRSRMGREPGVFKRFRRGVAESPFMPLLSEAAAKFIEEDIAPAAWCAFSVDVWRMAGQKSAPPVKWVFAAKRIEERAGWYRRESESYSGGRLLYTDTARDFMRRQANLRDALHVQAPRTETELRALVAHYFPAGLYDELLAALRAEATVLNDELVNVVSLGEWVW